MLCMAAPGPSAAKTAAAGADLCRAVQGDKRYAALLFTYGMQQINYMLGDSGRSFVIGFGKDAPQRPFHKWCACCC